MPDRRFRCVVGAAVISLMVATTLSATLSRHAYANDTDLIGSELELWIPNAEEVRVGFNPNLPPFLRDSSAEHLAILSESETSKACQSLDLGDYDSALDHGLRAVVLATEVEKPELMCPGLIVCGRVLGKKLDFTGARNFFQWAADVASGALDEPAVDMPAPLRARLFECFGDAELMLLDHSSRSSRYGQSAIACYSSATELYEEIGDVESLARVKHNMGWTWDDIADRETADQVSYIRKAITLYLQAADIRHRLGKHSDEYQSRCNVGYALSRLNDNARALDVYESILRDQGDDFEDISSSVVRIRALMGKSFCLNNEFKLSDSMDCLKEACDISERIGAIERQVSVLQRLGQASAQMERYDDALNYYSRALALSPQTASSRSRSDILQKKGTLLSDLGLVDEATDAFKEAYQIRKDSGFSFAAGETLGNIGVSYCLQGEPQDGLLCLVRARQLMQEGLKESVSINSPINSHAILGDISLCQMMLKQWEEANSTIRVGLDEVDIDPRIRVFLLDCQGQLDSTPNSPYFDLQKARQHLDQSLQIRLEWKDYRGVGRSYGYLAHVCELEGNYSDALEFLSKQEEVYRNLGWTASVARSIQQQALLHAISGQPNSALEDVNRFTELSTAILRQYHWESGLKSNVLSDFHDSLVRVLERESASISPIDEWEMLQSCKGLAVRQRSEERALEHNHPELSAQLDDFRRDCTAIELFRGDLYGQTQTETEVIRRRREELQQAVAEKEEAIKVILATLRAGGEPEFGSTLADLFELQARLGPEDLILDYFVVPKPRQELPEFWNFGVARSSYGSLFQYGSYETASIVVFALTRDAITRVPLPVDPSGDFDHWLNDELLLLGSERPEEYGPASSALYGVLLAPLENLLSQYSQLWVIPDGALSRVPFAGLMSPMGCYLVEHHSIAYVTNASQVGLALIKPEEGKTLLCGADSDAVLAVRHAVPGLQKVLSSVSTEPVPGLSEHLASLAEILHSNLLPHVTEPDLRDAAPRSTLTHLVAHGVFSPVALLNGVVLWPAEDVSQFPHSELQGNDGFLAMTEVMSLPLESGSMVVLDCCYGATGSNVRDQSLTNLAEGFLFAGAGVVVAANNVVDIGASQVLATEMYSDIMKEDRMSVPEALRSAQCTLLYAGLTADGSSHPEYRSPRYWCGMSVFVAR